MNLPLVTLDPKAVAAAIKDAPNQTDGVLALYRMIYPQWDDIEQVGTDPEDTVTYAANHVHHRQTWPACNKTTWKNICRFFTDRGQQGNVMPGGPWMNSGFTTDDTLPDWKVRPAPFKLKTPCPSTPPSPSPGSPSH